MTTIIRPLEESDVDQIEAILRSRGKIFNNLPIDIDRLKTLYIKAPRSLGLFEDDVLDCFITWMEFNLPSPRATDETQTDQPFAKVFGNWSMNKPDRVKLPSGHDKNGGELQSAVINAFRDYGTYTYWYQFPATWQGWPENPTVAATLVGWDVWVSDPIAPDASPSGPRAEFLSKYIMPKNTTPEPMVLRSGTLRVEHRPQATP